MKHNILFITLYTHEATRDITLKNDNKEMIKIKYRKRALV